MTGGYAKVHPLDNLVELQRRSSSMLIRDQQLIEIITPDDLATSEEAHQELFQLCSVGGTNENN